MNSKKKIITIQKNYHLSLVEKLKVLEIRKRNPKATGAVILKLFYEETERSITDSTLRIIIKNRGQPWNMSGIFDFEVVIIPHNINNSHWTISVVFLKRKEILYYDSYHAENLNILEKIFTSLDLENVAAFGVELYRPDWKLNCVMNTSLQRNGVDCGCHALIIAENISRRCLNFDFQTKEINSYREKIAYEIIAGNLFEQKLCADF